MHGTVSPRRVVAEQETPCAFCGAMKYWRYKYCGTDCYASDLAEKGLKAVQARLTVDSTMKSGYVRRACLKHGLLDRRCYTCGITEWCGQPAPLELDHINGINTDNRIENLRLLCANCHAQTDTYCGKNIGNGARSRAAKGV